MNRLAHFLDQDFRGQDFQEMNPDLVGLWKLFAPTRLASHSGRKAKVFKYLFNNLMLGNETDNLHPVR